jgi:hypothetical protein
MCVSKIGIDENKKYRQQRTTHEESLSLLPTPPPKFFSLLFVGEVNRLLRGGFGSISEIALSNGHVAMRSGALVRYLLQGSN